MPQFDCEGLVEGAVPGGADVGGGVCEGRAPSGPDVGEGEEAREVVVQSSVVPPAGLDYEGEGHVAQDWRKRS